MAPETLIWPPHKKNIHWHWHRYNTRHAFSYIVQLSHFVYCTIEALIMQALQKTYTQNPVLEPTQWHDEMCISDPGTA